jgi:protein phosphatase 1 regulatory subunit 7
LTSIGGLDNNPKLRVLDVSNNMIEHLSGLEKVPLLEELWASSNKLASFQEVEDQLADKENLETVYLEGNPLQRDAGATYRNKIKLALPRVKQIDATFVRT